MAFVNDVVKKTYMRRNGMTPNPPMIKSGSDGLIYKRTGKVRNLDYVRPKGRVYTVPKSAKMTSEWDKLAPFKGVMKKALKAKGLEMPDNLSDAGQLFFNHIVAAKGFNGNKPQNFEAMDNADAQVAPTVVDQLLTYFKSLTAGVQPNGQPLTTQDKKLSGDVQAVVNDLRAKAANAGLSPQDQVAAGVHLLDQGAPKPGASFMANPNFKWLAIGAVVLIILFILK